MVIRSSVGSINDMTVMLEGEYVEREIQPESMWTGLTVDSLGAGSWQSHLRRSELGFEHAESDIWLPHFDIAEQDLVSVAEAVASVKPKGNALLPAERFELVRNAVGRVSVMNAGCWNTEADTSYQVITDIADIYTNHNVLEAEENLDDIRCCDLPGCLYPRHYDFTFDVPSGRRELVSPNLAMFSATDSHVYTAWGDILPSVQDSRDSLIAFQKRCLPNVDRPDSLLTLGGISQIQFIPATGCWFNKSYYMTPIGVEGFENWQYDGYGRLRIPSLIAEKFGRTRSFAELGHRVVWLLHGNDLPSPKEKVLNHMCGFRPCCNPGHMELITPGENTAHGVAMAAAIRQVNGSMAS